MTEDTSQWIWIPNWDDFQHYHDRRPTWIKAYIELLAKPEYLDLTLSERGILHGLWLVAARDGNGRLAHTQVTVRRALGLPRYFRLAALDPLNHARFIDFRSSKGEKPRYQGSSTEGLLRKPRRAAAQTASAAPPPQNGESPHLGDLELRERLAKINREQMGGPA